MTTRPATAGRPGTVRWVVAIAVVVGSAIRVPQLFHSLAEAYAFRWAQTAWVAREYAENGIDLAHTPLPVFGPDSDVPMEFPLFQAIASLGISAGLPADVATRLLGLLSFQATAILLALLVHRWFGARATIVAIVAFEVLPFGLYWGTASLIDFFSVTLSLGMVLGLARFIERRDVLALAAGSIAAVLAFLVKPTTAPLWGVLLVAVAVVALLEHGPKQTIPRVAIALVGPIAGFAAALAWTAYADGIKAADPLTRFLTSAELGSWNLGDLAQRLDPHVWLRIGAWIVTQTALPLGIPLLFAVVAAIRFPDLRRRILLWGWIGTAAVAPLVFTNLYYVHNYYEIAIYPAIVGAMAVGMTWAIESIRPALWRRIAVAAIIVGAGASALLIPRARDLVVSLVVDAPIPAGSTAIAENTTPGDRIVTIGCDWDPITLYYAEREGLMIRDGAPDPWTTRDIDDYAYLYSCDAGLDPQDALPAGTRANPTGSPGLYALTSD